MPRWSPDGRTIVYESRMGASSDIWVVPAAGGEARKIVGDPSADRFPDWSPDGQWLAFQSNRSGSNRIWRVPAAGGQAEPVSKVAAFGGRWSADGKWIYFPSLEPVNIWGVSLDGRFERPMTSLVGKRGLVDVNALSTDGKYLYFVWNEDLGDLWVMDVVQGHPEPSERLR